MCGCWCWLNCDADDPPAAAAAADGGDDAGVCATEAGNGSLKRWLEGKRKAVINFKLQGVYNCRHKSAPHDQEFWMCLLLVMVRGIGRDVLSV